MYSADIIIKNANIITMDKAYPHASALAISGEEITFVGNNEDINGFTGKNTKVIDCGNRVVIPGFIDAHCHLFSLIRKLITLDLSPENVKSIEDIKKVIREKAQKTPPGQWISGTGYNEFYLAEKRHPTRRDLDEATTEHPVITTHRSLHACVLNSAALSLVGISSATEEQPGTRIDRNVEDGEPNGILYEMVGYIREHVMPPVSQNELDSGANQASEQLLSCGITSIQDASITNDTDRWNNLQRMKRTGIFLPRAAMMTGPDNFHKFLDSGFTCDYGDDNLRFLGLKIIPSESTGKLYPPQEELDKIVIEYARQGFPVAIHAVTNNMVEAVIGSFAKAKTSLQGKILHFRIEHCSECTPVSLERLKQIKPIIVSQPPFVYYSGDRYLKIIAAESIPWLYRFKSLMNAGLTVAAGSDSPVTPFSPTTGIYAATTRHTAEGQFLNIKETVSRYEALQMYTVNAAHASSEEHNKGSITPGKLADIAILNGNPLTCDPERLKDINVDMTIIGGKIVWER